MSSILCREASNALVEERYAAYWDTPTIPAICFSASARESIAWRYTQSEQDADPPSYGQLHFMMQ
ncbi:MAG: hypothetical protein KGQ60_09445, partial [Planctomycetes bacterium]|nr:hypothetical protein [Planctomycetota bacterium]